MKQNLSEIILLKIIFLKFKYYINNIILKQKIKIFFFIIFLNDYFSIYTRITWMHMSLTCIIIKHDTNKIFCLKLIIYI